MTKQQSKLKKSFRPRPNTESTIKTRIDQKSPKKTHDQTPKHMSEFERRKISHEAQTIAYRFLGVPLKDSKRSTIKQFFDTHQQYRALTRNNQAKILLRNAKSRLTIQEFWQGLADAPKFPPEDPKTFFPNVQELIHRFLRIP